MSTELERTLERNKENVKAFYDLMFNQCRPREALERYAGEEYRQHNTHVADGTPPRHPRCPHRIQRRNPGSHHR